MVMPVLVKKSLKRLEPDDKKLSSPVLRGRKKWQRFFCYPTLTFLIRLFRKKKVLLLSLLMFSLYFQNVLAAETSFNQMDSFDAISQNFVQNKEKTTFYIFASFSLSNNVLRQMIDYAEPYNGIIVFRGLENNSFKTTSEHIQKIAKEDDEAAIIIDPTLFVKFQINHVPSFILAKAESCAAQMSCSNSYDKLSGSVTPRFALEKFAEKGELSKDAARILKVRR